MNERQSTEHTYEQAGVDNVSGARAKHRIGEMIRETYTDGVLGDFGHFGGMFQAPDGADQILVSSADSVGTKVLLASLANRHQGIGVDLVNHSLNDILCCGARPLFFLDYFATSSLDETVLAELVEGMTSACRAAECALIGGETAQLPGVYHESAYDLAGFIVGVVDRDRIIDGTAIRPGHQIVGFASNGLHTNGYSLARSVFSLSADTPDVTQRLDQHFPELGETLADALLRPHRSYLPVIRPLLEERSIAGLAHITGGGIAGNLERIVPDDCVAVVDTTRWQVPALFELIRSTGNVPTSEMFAVFNMGIGFIAVCDEENAARITASVEDAYIIGEVREANGDPERVKLTGISQE